MGNAEYMGARNFSETLPHEKPSKQHKQQRSLNLGLTHLTKNPTKTNSPQQATSEKKHGTRKENPRREPANAPPAATRAKRLKPRDHTMARNSGKHLCG